MSIQHLVLDEITFTSSGVVCL